MGSMQDSRQEIRSLAMAVYDLLLRLVLKIAGVRISLEVSQSAPEGEPILEEFCGTLVNGYLGDRHEPESDVEQGVQESRSSAGEQSRGVQAGTPWPERLTWADKAGTAAADFVRKEITDLPPKKAPIGKHGNQLAEKVWVVVRDQDTHLLFKPVVFKRLTGSDGAESLLGQPVSKWAVFHGFPSQTEADAYIAAYNARRQDWPRNNLAPWNPWGQTSPKRSNPFRRSGNAALSSESRSPGGFQNAGIQESRRFSLLLELAGFPPSERVQSCVSKAAVMRYIRFDARDTD
jgi:hypothetical protein